MTSAWAKAIACVAVASGLLALGFTETEIVSSALGEVRPEGEVVRIQAPRSGRLVSWGPGPHERVHAGAELARLDATVPAAHAAALHAALTARLAEVERLQALLAEFAAPGEPHPQPNVDATHAAARQLEHAIRIRTALEQQNTERALARAQVRERDLHARQQWIDKVCAAERQLVRAGAVPARELWQSELDCVDGLREQHEAEAESTLAGLAVARGHALEAERRRQLLWQWRAALQEAEVEAQRLAAEREVALAQVRESVLTAPIHGYLEPANILHPGVFVQSGELLAQLVPLGVVPMVSAQLPEAERNGVTLGQAVRIRVHALPWTRYGSVPGRVQAIAAAAEPVDGSPPLFTVAIKPEGHPLTPTLQPGMQATVDFLRGRESLWRWALRPLQETWLTALREP